MFVLLIDKTKISKTTLTLVLANNKVLLKKSQLF